MFNKKRSLFSRLSGSVPNNSSYDAFEDEFPEPATQIQKQTEIHNTKSPDTDTNANNIIEEDSGAGELPVDVLQTADEIIIHAFVAGVRPDELNVSISRDVVIIEGTRAERQQVSTADYFTQELFWGSFTRTIMLPQEVDVDNATAHSKDGLLTLTLPKLDRTRQTKLKVKVG
ncbi:hypothetical protein MNBD_CPR01-496 [hydrothermal vent metagenome]|uniref:SHSP domain-containing protein n=1 Tax=hydrothermal vent metagenome TaxID=652676 RepID=A0A3B0UW05_9ZZZZ